MVSTISARGAGLLSALLLMLASASTAAATLSLEDIVSMRQVTSAQLSPDGQQIAYTVGVPRTVYKDDDGGAWAELHLSDLDGNTRPFVTGEVNVSSPLWSADSQHVYFLAKRDPEAKTNSLYRIAINGGEAQLVFTHSSNISGITLSPDGETLAFIAKPAGPEQEETLQKLGFKAEVFEESLKDSMVHLLDLDELTITPLELEGSVSDMAFAPDGELLAVAIAPTPLVDDSLMARDIAIMDLSRGQIERKLNHRGKLGAFAFSPDGSQLAYIAGEDINDPAEGRLYVTAVDGQERRELVPDYAGHVEAFAWKDMDEIRWLGNRGLWREWRVADVDNPAPVDGIATDGPIITSVSTYPGMTVTAALANTPEHPSELYLLRDDNPPQRLTDSNPWLAERELMPQEAISYTARDGLELEAVYLPPAKRKRGGNPLIVVAHGGPEANYSNGWLNRYSSPAQYWAAQGYAVVFPNYRGSTGRGVGFSKMGQQDYAEEEFNDLVDAKRHLVNEDVVDPDRVGITGGSYGGYASMWSASALTEEYAAAVAFVGVSNQVSKFGTSDIPLEMFHVHARQWPWDDWLWMLERSPVYHAGNTKTPLLLMHGAEDPRVHPAQSMEMYRFVKVQTDTPVRLVFYPGEGHGNRKTAAQFDYALRLVRWMDHYLDGPGGEPPPYEVDHAARLEAAGN